MQYGYITSQEERKERDKATKIWKNVNLLKHERPYNRGTLDVGIFEQSVYVRQ